MGLNMIVDNYANYGKCFGYNKDEQFLFSLSYLCAIDAFHDWDVSLCDVNSRYDYMMEYFRIAQFTPPIHLTQEQFSHFIQLYQADHKLIGLYPFKEQTYIPSDDYVTIQWM